MNDLQLDAAHDEWGAQLGETKARRHCLNIAEGM
jgi:hypothetical protein